MKFQIIDTTTKQPINLAEFDSKYCTITGTPELSKEFGAVVSLVRRCI